MTGPKIDTLQENNQILNAQDKLKFNFLILYTFSAVMPESL